MIVILDGYTTTRDDLNWKQLEALDTVVAYDRTPATLTVERCRDAEIVLTNKVLLGAEELKQLPKLKYIGVLATGYNVVDLAAAKERGIVVTNIPAYSTASVAQLVFAHLFNVVGRVDHYARENRNNRWCHEPDINYLDHPWRELAAMRIGIVGMGNIGTAVARIALAFDMDVVAYSSKPQEQLPAGVTKVDLDTLYGTCDVISLNCPLNEATHWMINTASLAMMKPSAIVINTGRGPLVNEDDMAEALRNNVIAAYCTDVIAQEPPVNGNPLFAFDNCYVTPHIAWASCEARQRLVDICVGNVRAFLDGKPINVVG